MSFISVKNRTGTPIQADKITITPISQVLKISAPGTNGGMIWNRPVAVQVENERGESNLLPVQDYTRQAIVLFTVTGLVFAFLSMFVRRRTRQ